MRSEPTTQARPSGGAAPCWVPPLKLEGQQWCYRPTLWALAPVPGDCTHRPLGSVPWWCGYVQCRGHGVQSSNAPSGGVGMLGGCGLHSWDACARAAGGLLGTPGLYSHRAPSPLHRAEPVTCNSVEVQSLVNVNSSSLKSLVKESQKCVACMWLFLSLFL